MNGLGYAQSQGPGLVSVQHTQQELGFFVKRGAKLVWPCYEQTPNTCPPPLLLLGRSSGTWLSIGRKATRYGGGASQLDPVRSMCGWAMSGLRKALNLSF